MFYALSPLSELAFLFLKETSYRKTGFIFILNKIFSAVLLCRKVLGNAFIFLRVNLSYEAITICEKAHILNTKKHPPPKADFNRLS